jgi:hypothetical protein
MNRPRNHYQEKVSGGELIVFMKEKQLNLWCGYLLFLDTYQAAENSTYPHNINRFNPTSRAPICKGANRLFWR